jgi:hypothetical protein
MPPNLAQLTRSLLTELHASFLAGRASEGLESALCEYVDHWRGAGTDADRIVDVTEILIERVRAEHPEADSHEKSLYDTITAQVLERCVVLSRG